MGKILGTSKLSRKGQVTIPKTVRILLELKEGDIIVFELKENNQITIKKGEITIK